MAIDIRGRSESTVQTEKLKAEGTDQDDLENSEPRHGTGFFEPTFLLPLKSSAMDLGVRGNGVFKTLIPETLKSVGFSSLSSRNTPFSDRSLQLFA